MSLSRIPRVNGKQMKRKNYLRKVEIVRFHSTVKYIILNEFLMYYINYISGRQIKAIISL